MSCDQFMNTVMTGETTNCFICAGVKELEDVINLKTLELSKFQGIVDTITSENEQLRELQINQIHSIANQTSSKSGHGINTGERKFGSFFRDNVDTNTVLQTEIIAELNERIDILMTENGLLAEQKLSLSHELEQHHSDLTNSNTEVITLQSNYKTLKKEHNNLKLLLQQVESDRNEAGVQALKYSEGLSRADAQVHSLQSELVAIQRRENEVSKSYHDLQKEMESTKKSYEDELFQTMKTVRILEDRIRELQVVLLEKSQEIDSSQDLLRKLRREYQSTRQDAEGMLQVMSGLEKQLSEFAARESEVEKLAKDSKVKVSEAISARDQVQHITN